MFLDLYWLSVMSLSCSVAAWVVMSVVSSRMLVSIFFIVVLFFLVLLLFPPSLLFCFAGVVFCFVWCGGGLWYKVTIKKWNMEVSGVCFGFGCFSVFFVGWFCCVVFGLDGLLFGPEETLFDPERFGCLYCCVLYCFVFS